MADLVEKRALKQKQKADERLHVVPISLHSLFFTFLKIGCTAFGGFMALISVVQNYAVERKKIISHEDMLDGVSLATILPGPVAVNVVAYVGYRVRGSIGAVISATAVTLPAFVLLVILSYAYFAFGHISVFGKLFQGFVPAVAAIIISACWNMAGKAIRGVPEALIAVASCGLLLGVGGFAVTIALIAASGCCGWFLFKRSGVGTTVLNKASDSERETDSAAGIPNRLSGMAGPVSAVAAFGFPAAVIKLLFVFGGMSLLLFGGGYVFIPLIQRIVVEGHGWVTRQEFIDAIALGQVTPGPILISAAFIGYKVAGIPGATAATLGIFTPPALVMILCTSILDRIKRSGAINAALRGIRPAVVGMIAAAAVIVARTGAFNWVSLLIFSASLIALLRFKLETAWIIPASALLGLLLY